MSSRVIPFALFFCFGFSFFIHKAIAADDTDVVIENAECRLVISATGKAISLVHKASGQECLQPDTDAPVFAVTQYTPYDNELQLTYPAKEKTFAANSVTRVADDLIVRFELINIEATIGLKITDDYIGFSLKKIDYKFYKFGDTRKTPVDEFTLLQLPVRNRDHFGEWLNVVWDEDLAVNVLATDAYARIDAVKHKNYHLLQAATLSDVKTTGVGAALITTKKNNLLDRIDKVERDYHLPLGVASRRSQQYKYSYLELKNVTTQNIDEYISYARKAGFRAIQILWSDFAKTMGHLPWRPEYPNGIEDLKTIVSKVKKAGIVPGIHIHYNKAYKDDRYVSPVPDHRLNLRSIFTLARLLDKNSTTITVEENPHNSTLDEGRRILRIGNELIEYENFTTELPYQFTGCNRAALNTTASFYTTGFKLGLLDVDTWNIFVRFDQKTSIQQEVADRIGKLYKEAGFEFVYFDGAEDVPPPYWYNVSAAQLKVYNELQPFPVFSEGALKSHFSWHILTRGNAFDVFEPEVIKEATRKHPVAEAKYIANDFTSINFGWIEYFLPNDKTTGIQPDMIEYVCSKAAGWDSPISVIARLEQLKNHPRTNDNLETIRRWEEARITDLLSEEQKKSLQDESKEHFLLLNEKGNLELCEYEQINFADSALPVRAFVFERNDKTNIVYWHVSGEEKIELDKAKWTLYKDFDKSKINIQSKNGKMIMPANDRHYLQTTLSKKEAIKIFSKAKMCSN